MLLSTITHTAMRGPFVVCRHADCPSSKLRPRARHVQFDSARAAESNAPTAARVARITAPARRFRSKLFIATTLHSLVTHRSRCSAHSGPAVECRRALAPANHPSRDDRPAQSYITRASARHTCLRLVPTSLPPGGCRRGRGGFGNGLNQGAGGCDPAGGDARRVFAALSWHRIPEGTGGDNLEYPRRLSAERRRMPSIGARHRQRFRQNRPGQYGAHMARVGGTRCGDQLFC